MFTIYTALITPFNEYGAIDLISLKKVVDHLVQQGNKHFVVCGTTGEASTLRMYEKKQLLRYLCGHYPECHFIAGISSNSTHEAIKQVQEFDCIKGIEGYLVVVPYYVKPNQKGIYEHFRKISKNTAKQILLYNVPHRCGTTISEDTIKQLINTCPTIVGIKQADDITKMIGIKKQYPNFKVYCGNDDQLYKAITLGMDGIVSVLSHIAYKEMLELSTKPSKINDEHLQIDSHYLFVEPSPSVIKYILSSKGFIHNYLRLPMVTVTTQTEQLVQPLIEKYL